MHTMPKRPIHPGAPPTDPQEDISYKGTQRYWLIDVKFQMILSHPLMCNVAAPEREIQADLAAEISHYNRDTQ